MMQEQRIEIIYLNEQNLKELYASLLYQGYLSTKQIFIQRSSATYESADEWLNEHKQQYQRTLFVLKNQKIVTVSTQASSFLNLPNKVENQNNDGNLCILLLDIRLLVHKDIQNKILKILEKVMKSFKNNVLVAIDISKFKGEKSKCEEMIGDLKQQAETNRSIQLKASNILFIDTKSGPIVEFLRKIQITFQEINRIQINISLLPISIKNQLDHTKYVNLILNKQIIKAILQMGFTKREVFLTQLFEVQFIKRIYNGYYKSFLKKNKEQYKKVAILRITYLLNQHQLSENIDPQSLFQSKGRKEAVQKLKLAGQAKKKFLRQLKENISIQLYQRAFLNINQQQVKQEQEVIQTKKIYQRRVEKKKHGLKQILKSLFEEYAIKNDQEIFKLIIKQKLSQIKKYLKKNGDKFISQLQKYDQLKSFYQYIVEEITSEKEQIEKILEEKREHAVLQLRTFLNRYKIKYPNKWLNCILKKQFSKLRQFQQLDEDKFKGLSLKIKNCKQLLAYWSKFQDLHQDQSLEEKRSAAEQIVQSIMIEFKISESDQQDFINEIFNRNYQQALFKTAKNKRQKLQKILQQSPQIIAYFAQLQKLPNYVEEQSLQQNINQGQSIDNGESRENQRNQRNNIVEYLQMGRLHELKERLGYHQFYRLIQQLIKQTQYVSLLNRKQVEICQSLSYFFYYRNSVSLFDIALTSILKQSQAYSEPNTQNTWLKHFHRLDAIKGLLFFRNQLQLFKEAIQYNPATDNSLRGSFLDLLKQVFKILVVRYYRTYKNYPFDFQIITRYMQEFLQDTIQSWINQMMTKSLRQKIKWSTLDNRIDSFEFSKQNQREYISNKRQQLNYYLFKEFYLSFKEQISKFNVDVYNENIIICQIVCLAQVTIKDIAKMILTNSREKDIEIDNYFIQFAYVNKNVLVSEQDHHLDERPLKITLHQKRNISVYWQEIKFNIKISNTLNAYFLKQIIINSLAKENLKGFAQSLKSKLIMKGLFGKQSLQRIIDDTIQAIQSKMKQRKLYQINLINLLSVKILHQSTLHQFQMEYGQSIIDLKRLLQKKNKIAIDSQRLKYMKGEFEQQIINEALNQLPNRQGSIAMRLQSKVNAAYYGFHVNRQLSYIDFSLFTIDDDKRILELYETCSLHEQQQKQFFFKTISLLFSGLKRKFSFSFVVDKIRRIFSQKQAIWQSPRFNDSFLTFYILYNSQPALRIQLMKLISSPLPLYFKVFSNINSIQNKWEKNQQLAWLLSQSLTFASIGLHNQSNIEKQQGKTFLNNMLFQTDFLQRSNKHSITLGCPEVVLKVFGKIKPFNFIQTSSDTPQEILAQILSASDYLIVHSWKSRKETSQFIHQTQMKFGFKKVFCFLRDNGSKQATQKKLKEIKLSDPAVIIQTCQLPIGESRQNKQFISLLRTKFWFYFNQTNKQMEIQGNRIEKLFSNKTFEQFNQILQTLKTNFYLLGKVSQKYEKMKKLKREFTSTSSRQLQNLKTAAINQGLAHQLQNILAFIHQNRNISWLLILRLKDYLKIIKQSYEKQYQMINKSKNEIIMMNQARDWQKINFIYQSTRKMLRNCPIQIQIGLCKSRAQIYEQFAKATDFFENEVKTKSFTIQMFWRQLEYLVGINDQVKIGNFYLHDFLLELKRQQIHRNQPLQMIDGDLLQMMRKNIKKCFEGITDRVAVVSIIGKQSSGKSTLLNFLFGCDFATSEGRCTRGVYGTYYKFSKVKFSNCQGLFVIDTEGLFAPLNKKDKQTRMDFESRLALFCFAISDLVIVNVQRNLDSNTFRILESSWAHLDAVSSENKKPQIIIVSNQNSSTSTSSNASDLKELEELLNCKTIVHLNQAYNTVKIDHEHTPIIPQGQIFFKSKPQKYFLMSTSKIQEKIKALIEQISNIKMVRRFIDEMQKIWSTIQAFSLLSKTDSKTVQNLQTQLKNWRNGKEQILFLLVAELFNQFKNQKLTRQQCIVELKSKIRQFQLQFESNFQNVASSRGVSVQERNKIQSQRQKMMTMFDIIEKQLTQIKISKYERLLKAQVSKSEGSYHIRHAITTVLNYERQNGRKLSVEEKLTYFEDSFYKALAQLKKSIYISKDDQNSYFSSIYDLYQNSMKLQSSNIRSFTGLPNKLDKNFYSSQQQRFQDFSQQLMNYIMSQKFQNSNKVIQFKRFFNIYARYQKNQRLNEDLYFKMSQYFTTEQISVFFEISKEILIKKCLNHEQIIKEICIQLAQNRDIRQLQSNIFESINKILIIIGLTFMDFDQFHNIIHLQTKEHKSIEDFAIWVKLTKNYEVIDEQYPIVQPKTFFIQQTSKQLLNKQGQMEQQQPLSSLQRIIEDNKDIELFINVQQVKKLRIIINSPINKQILQKHLQKTIIKLIKWANIKQYIEKTVQFATIKEKLNKDIGQKLSSDFKLLGLHFKSKSIYNYLFRQRNTEQIQLIQSTVVSEYKEGQSLATKLQGLQYIYLYKINQNLSKSIKKENRSGTLKIGFKNKIKKILDEKYIKINQLLQLTHQGCEKQNNYSLNCETIKQFIFSQLINKRSIHRLLQKISNLVKEGPQQLNNKSINQLYSSINLQLQKFSLDIDEASYKPTSLFNGYVHLFAVYLIWKKYMLQIQKSSQKPYEELLQTKLKQRQFFLKQTSNDWQTRSQAEAERIIQWILSFYSKKTQFQKEKITIELSQQFKKKYPRKDVQQRIDNQLYSKNNKSQRLIQYLQKPSEVIKQYYKNQASKYKQLLQKRYKQRIPFYGQIIQFKKIIEQLLSQLVTLGINKDIFNSALLDIEKTNRSTNTLFGNDVEEKLSQILLYIVLDMITGVKNQSYYIKESKVLSKLPTINWNTQSYRFLQDISRQLKKQSFTVSNLYIFLDNLAKMLGHNNTKQRLQKYLICNREDLANFQAKTQVFVCSQKCPGCGRPCGVSTIHTAKHQVLYGHQVRGFNKVCYKNRDSSVMRCEDIPSNSSILVKKGQDRVEITWKQFILQFESLQQGSWIFDDLKLDDKKDFFINVWRQKGKQVCNKFSLNYMDFNSIQYQKAHLQDSIIHFLFVLDHSDSMTKDNRGKNLQQSFSRTIMELKQRQQPDIVADQSEMRMKNPIRVTVLTFSDKCFVVQEDVTSFEANIQLPQMKGGTSFSQALKKSFQILKKYTQRKDIIKFIFMTDGKDFPLGNQLKLIKELQNQPGNFIQYFGIQFKINEQFMKIMSQQLKGKNKIQTDAQGLTNTFLEIIQISIN